MKTILDSIQSHTHGRESIGLVHPVYCLMSGFCKRPNTKDNEAWVIPSPTLAASMYGLGGMRSQNAANSPLDIRRSQACHSK